jgi:hypothetical protein
LGVDRFSGAVGDESSPYLGLPPDHPPAPALNSLSSSAYLDTNVGSSPRKFLDYEQEPVQVQEKEKD